MNYEMYDFFGDAGEYAARTGRCRSDIRISALTGEALWAYQTAYKGQMEQQRARTK